MSSKVLKVEDLQLGAILVRKKIPDNKRIICYQITEIKPDGKSYRYMQKYPKTCLLTNMVCKIKVIPKTKRERKIVYTQITQRQTDISNWVEVEKILSEYEFYNPNKKYEADRVDSDSDSDYDYDSDVIRKNMKSGSLLVKKPSTKNGKYKFYKLCRISYFHISLIPQDGEKSYHKPTGPNKLKIGYKPVLIQGFDTIEVSRDYVVSNYEVYDPNKKYEVEMDNVAIYDYDIVDDSDYNHYPVQNPVKINIAIGKIVVQKPSTKYGQTLWVLSN